MNRFQIPVLALTACCLAAAGRAAQNPPLPAIPTNTFRVTEYGAVGNGKTMNTVAIQKAIDAASKAGGGIVLVPEGRFLTGPFTLTSRINLHLANNAVILMSDDMTNHPIANE